MYLRDATVKEQTIGIYNLVVRAAGSSAAGKLLDEGVLRKLADFAGNLPFRPEIQVRGKRIVAYPADRNATVDDVETLKKLAEFTRSVAFI